MSAEDARRISEKAVFDAQDAIGEVPKKHSSAAAGAAAGAGYDAATIAREAVERKTRALEAMQRSRERFVSESATLKEMLDYLDTSVKVDGLPFTKALEISGDIDLYTKVTLYNGLRAKVESFTARDVADLEGMAAVISGFCDETLPEITKLIRDCYDNILKADGVEPKS